MSRKLESNNNSAVPVVLISGFLGSGKTTLMHHILKNKQGIRCALLVNDMAEINIDANLIQGTKLLKNDEKMVELHNGCICCTLREDLLKELVDLGKSGKFDCIIIEGTGISEPKEVAETFFHNEQTDVKDPKSQHNQILNKITRLDNCITLVDTSSFLTNMTEITHVNEKWQYEGMGDDQRSVSKLLMDQVEFANVVLLNKIDLVNKKTVRDCLTLVKKLNPTANVMECIMSKVDLKHLLFTNNFKEEFGASFPDWMQSFRHKNHIPETIEYGITSFVYRSETPFHPKRLFDFFLTFFILREDQYDDDDIGLMPNTELDLHENQITEAEKLLEEREKEELRQLDLEQSNQVYKHRMKNFGNLLRSKGYIWIGSPKRYNAYGKWSQAGNVMTFGFGGIWDEFPNLESKKEDYIKKKPITELVLIGQDLKKENITSSLNKCLLTKRELAKLEATISKENGFNQNCFKDPFFAWPAWIHSNEDFVRDEIIKKMFDKKGKCLDHNH